MAQSKDNSGALFKNDRKREGKQDADYNGSAVVGGVEYWVNSWVNTKKEGGGKYLSLKFRSKQEARAGGAPPGDSEPFDDSDLPF